MMVKGGMMVSIIVEQIHQLPPPMMGDTIRVERWDNERFLIVRWQSVLLMRMNNDGG